MNFLLILVLVPSFVVSRYHHNRPRPTFVQCQKPGVKCVGIDEFTYCSIRSKFVILEFDTLNCPEGYICQENSRDPCIPDPEYQTAFSDECNQDSGSEESEETSEISNEGDNDKNSDENSNTTTVDDNTTNAGNNEDQRNADTEVDTIHCLETDEEETTNTEPYFTLPIWREISIKNSH